MSTAAAVAVVVGTAVSVDASRKAAAATKEKGKVISAQQRVQDRSTQRQAARTARIKQAQIEQAAETSGVAGSSSEASAKASLSTQVAANQARISGQQLGAASVTNLNNDIADAQVQSTLGSGISSVGSQAFSATGGFDNLFKD
tara:strand:- start:3588 stop:4019 length:432 start_codon:yes stop_codon:yes gene_type:complete